MRLERRQDPRVRPDPPAGVTPRTDLGEVSVAGAADAARVCLAGARGEALLCDPDGKVYARVTIPMGWSRAVFASDGSTVTIVSHNGAVLDVDAASGTVRRSGSCGHPVNGIVALADGAVLLRTLQNQVIARALDGSWRLLPLPAISALCAASDGHSAWAGTWSGEVFRFRPDGELLEAPRQLGSPGAVVTALAHSADAAVLLVGHSDGTALHWELATDTVRSLGSHRHAVTGFARSPDGAHIASVAMDGIVRVFDTAGLGAGQRIIESTFRLKHPLASAVAFVSPSRLVTGGADGVPRWWELEARALRRRLLR